MNAYDVLVVGSGPSAVAALMALSDEASVCVVTGESRAQRKSKKLHAKIGATAYESREDAKVIQQEVSNAGEKGAIYTSTGVGGLARYWGQQFVRYKSNDPWPNHVFETYKQYAETCAVIEEAFSLSPHDSDSQCAYPYIVQTSRLLLGTSNCPQAGLRSIALVCERILSQGNRAVVRHRVMRIQADGGGITVFLDEGPPVRAQRVILAAGVVGTLDILTRSSAKVGGGLIQDHAPILIYVLGAKRLGLRPRSDALEHFNACSIEKIESEQVKLFGSMYRMSHAPLSLTLAGLGLPLCGRGRKTPPFVDIITPIQVWTRSTECQYQLSANSLAVTRKPAGLPNDDCEFTAFQAWVRARGALIVKVSRSKPGTGFHYFGSRVIGPGKFNAGVESFLNEEYDRRVVCVDASILPAIGCRPNGLTAMASAYATTRRAFV